LSKRNLGIRTKLQEESQEVMEDLNTLRLQLALLRTGCLMVAEGKSRVTSSELLSKSRKEHGVNVLPSVVGQLLGSLGIPSTTSKGRTRFALDPEYLEPMAVELASQVEAVAGRVDSVVKSMGDIQARLAPLEERFERARRQQEREQELREYLREHKPFLSQVPFLEQECQRLQEGMARLRRLKDQVRSMEQRLETLPELENQKRSLADRVKALEAQREEVVQEEQDLAREERKLAGVINELKLQRGWVTLASLEQEIAQAQAELAGVKKEIKHHRSWLERLLRRKEERSPR
jgi:chromosome segregation ATPase